MYILTAVIPVYGISRNIENLRKVLVDIPQSIQVIIVHDTTDGENVSPLKEIATPSNFTILEAVGGSAGKTRNHAIPFIKSEWTVFWDADDRPFPMAILEAIHDSVTGVSDLIVGSFSRSKKNSLDQEDYSGTTHGIHPKDSFLTEFGIWRCIFRTTEIKDVYFDDLKIGEDLSYILRTLPSLSHKICFSNHKFYEYRLDTQGSVTNSELLNSDFEEALRVISNLGVKGDLETELKHQILLGLRLSQFKRFPSFLKLLKLVSCCFQNPMAVYNKVREMLRK
jgi:hypothetical protein